MEVLEDRCLLSHNVTFYLDFSPDATTPDNHVNDPGAFAQVFDLAYWQSQLNPSGPSQPSPLNKALWEGTTFDSKGRPIVSNKVRVLSLLDFNEDGTLDDKDRLGDKDAATALARDGAEKGILKRVRSHFQGVRKSLETNSDTEVKFARTGNAWDKLLSSAISSDDAYAMYIGNENPSGGYFGISFVAPAKHNDEYYGYAYAGELIKSMAKTAGPDDFGLWEPGEFVNSVASTVSHEFGHMLGLRHSLVARKDAAGNIVGYRNPAEGQLAGSLMSYGRLRWKNDARFDNRIYSSCGNINQDGTVSIFGPQNPRQEVYDSLGLLNGQVTDSLVGTGKHYFDSGEISDFGFEPPLRDNPPALLGTAAGKNVAWIVNQFDTGFTSLRDQKLGTIAAGANLSGGALPLIDSNLASLLDLGNSLKAAVSTVDLSSVVTVEDLTNALTLAGFTIDQLADPATFAPNAPADFLRISQTYRIADIQGTTSLSQDAIGALSDLTGVNLLAQMGITGNLALHLTIGVDSAGFYLLPGLLLDAPILARGDLAATLGGFGHVAGDATLDLRPTVTLAETAGDGRVRLTDLTSTALTTSVEGVAALNPNFVITVLPSLPAIEYGGSWLWQINSAGFAYDTYNSGFDQDSLLDSLADIAGSGIERLSGQAAAFARMTQNIPIIGDAIGSAITPLIADSLNYDDQLGSAREYLEDRGLEVVSLASPRDFIDGSFSAKDLLVLRYSHVVTPSSPVTFTADKSFESNVVGGTKMKLGLAGDVAGLPSLAFSVVFGISGSDGLFIQEGSSLSADLTVDGQLFGGLDLGDLIGVQATATGHFTPTAAITIGDFDGIPNEKLDLSTLDVGNIINEHFADAVSVAGGLSLAMTVKANTPADSIPVVGKYISGALTWRASVGYTLPSGPLTYDIDRNSLPSFGDIEKNLRDALLDPLEKYNPLPKEFRGFLTKQIGLLGGVSLSDVLGLDSVGILINPDAFMGRDNVDVNSGDDSEYVRLNYDFASVDNVVNLLSGQRADLFSLDIKQELGNFSTTIPIVPYAPLFNFLGLAQVGFSLDLVTSFEMGLQVLVGLDTEGFYVKAGDGSHHLLSATGKVGGKLALTGSLLSAPGILDVVRVSGTVAVVAEGVVDLKSSDPADPRLRFDDLYHNGSVNTSVLAFGLGVFLDVTLKGELGLLNFGLKVETDELPIVHFKLFELPNSSEPGGDMFKPLKDDIRAEAEKLAIAMAYPPFGIIWAYKDDIVKAGERAVDWAKDRGQEIIDGAQEIAGHWADEAKKLADKVLGPVEDFAKNVLGFDLSVLTNPAKKVNEWISDLNSILKGERWVPIGIPAASNENTLQANVVDGVLDVSWRVGKALEHLRQAGADITVGISEGQLVVDGPDFTMSVVVARRQKWVVDLKHPLGHWVDTDDTKTTNVTYSNTIAIALENVSRIEITGTDDDDSLAVMEFVKVPARLEGKGGDDLLVGGGGGDELYGGAGDDTLQGNQGDDLLEGQDGEDRLVGGLGNDTLRGGAGNDYLDEASAPTGHSRTTERNTLEGDDGNDRIFGSPGQDTIDGGRGSDTLYGYGGHDSMRGGPNWAASYDPELEKDFLDGGDGNDLMYGGIGVSYLVGGPGDDELHGGLDNDQLYGDDEVGLLSGSDTLFGDGGADNLVGGKGDDYLYGGAGPDLLRGGDGNDLLVGAESWNYEDAEDANDILDGGKGDDQLYGGPSGPGLANFPNIAQVGVDVLDGGDDADTVEGGSGPDHIFGGNGDDLLLGGAGEDILVGVAGSDTMKGGDDADRLLGSQKAVAGGFVGSTLEGNAGADELFGSADGGDTISGGDGKDNLNGLGGDDWLFGDNDDDAITGDWGNDHIFGGSGTDTILEDGDVNFTLTNTSLDGKGADTLSSVEVAILAGGASQNTFAVHHWSGLARLNASTNNDDYNIRLNGAGLGTYYITDSAGTDHVFVSGSDGDDVIDVSVGRVALGQEVVNYTDIEALTVNGGDGGDVVNVLATADVTPVAVNGDAGDDRVNIATGDLNAILGTVTASGGDGNADHVFLNDGGDPRLPNRLLVDYRITPDSVTSTNSPLAPMEQVRRTFAGLVYDGTVESLRLDGTDVANVFDVQPSLNTSYFIDGNLPAPGTVCAKHGDYLKLDTKTTFPVNPQGLDTSGRKLAITSRGNGYWDFTKAAHKRVEFESIERFNHVDIVAVGADAGRESAPQVNVYDAETNELKFVLPPEATYGLNYHDGIRVATGDLDNDGLPDVVTAPGRLMAPTIKVFNGAPMAGVEGTEITSLQIPASSTYGDDFINGVQVTVGDVAGDCLNDIIVVPSRGAAQVKVFENHLLRTTPYARIDLVPARSFDAFAEYPRYINGGTLATADLDGNADGNDKQDVIVASGSGLTGNMPGPATPVLFDPRTSAFHLRNSNTTGVADASFCYGPASCNWIPILGDWNGDGIETIGLYDPAASAFHLRETNSGGCADRAFYYGAPGAGWLPIAGDWDGDGIDTVGLYNQSQGIVYLKNSHAGGFADVAFYYGAPMSNWRPIAGDWNGDGKDTIGLYVPDAGLFYLRDSNTSGYADQGFFYGAAGAGWLPLAGDWDQDGVETVGGFVPASGVFYLRNSHTGGYADQAFYYGPAGAGWTPLVGSFCQTSGELPSLIRAFDVSSMNSARYAAIRQIWDTDADLRGGVQVATGDVTGDGILDIITGQGSAGHGLIRIYDGKLGSSTAPLASYQCFSHPICSAPTRVTARDIDGDDVAELFVPQGTDGRSGYQVRRLKAMSGAAIDAIFAEGEGDWLSGGGLFIG